MASAAAEVSSASSATPAAATERTTFHVGTRRSQLALWQTDRAVELLRAAWPGHTFEIHPMATMGDKNQVTALHQFNAKSLWTHELEAQLTDGRLDLIVHSLKDVPTQLPAGCALSGGCDRTERRDCIVMGPAGLRAGHKTLADLPAGSVVGTSSVRRIAQLAKIHPQLKIEDVRGNINTRLAKLDAADSPYSALILAAAGVQRIDEGARITSFLSRKEHGWYYPVGQGAIGLECRSDDKKVRDMCMAIMEKEKESTDGSSRGLRAWYEALAERMLLRTLEGGCSVPIGVDSVWEGEDQLTLYGMVLSVDGKQCVEGKKTHKVRSKEEAEAAGLDLAADLVERGAGKILEEIVLNRQILVEGGNA